MQIWTLWIRYRSLKSAALLYFFALKSLPFIEFAFLVRNLLFVCGSCPACFVRCKNVFPSLNWQRLQLSRPNKGLFVPYRLCFVHHHFGKWVVRALEWNWWWSTNRSCYYCWIDHDKKKNNWPCCLCQNAVGNRDKPVVSLGQKKSID